MKSYFIAVSSSIIMAVGLRKGFAKYSKGLTGTNVIVTNSISACVASCTAGYFNAYAMRSTEIKTGIDVMDPADPDTPIGIKSKVAAEIAVKQTANSRIVQNIPLLFPSMVFVLFEKLKIMPKKFWPKTMVQGLVFLAEIYLAIPLGVAYYPQRVEIDASRLEVEVQQWKNQNGQTIDKFVFNKGL